MSRPVEIRQIFLAVLFSQFVLENIEIITCFDQLADIVTRVKFENCFLAAGEFRSPYMDNHKKDFFSSSLLLVMPTSQKFYWAKRGTTKLFLSHYLNEAKYLTSSSDQVIAQALSRCNKSQML